ncbi:MAG TPA: hypothetical protein VND22_09615 [Actinomycetota bacterium]|nr:hypothetical protein [Actinomycetota bacterium]
MPEAVKRAKDWVVELEEQAALSLRQTDSGVFGLAEVVADFDEAEIERLRVIGEAIGTPPRPGVKSAIALAGSAAQSRFQLYPGDCDFFERVHIHASTREEAIGLLVSTMIETVGRVFTHPNLQFAEMRLGLHPKDSRRGEETYKAGSSISWSLGDLDSRSFPVEDADGKPLLIEMAEVAAEPGQVKIDWIQADHEKDRIVAVSKVIDATWESQDGVITALDGVLDSFYQEVYLDPESRSHVEKLIDQATPSGLRDYVSQLEKEIVKHSTPGKENWGKVAKRLYNIFRITNKSQPAEYLRQLFDDPAARLYQVAGALYALRQTMGKRRLTPETIEGQIDGIVAIIRECYTRPDKEELVTKAKQLTSMEDAQREVTVDEISEKTNDEVSDYFKDRLTQEPEIADYLGTLRVESAPGS